MKQKSASPRVSNKSSAKPANEKAAHSSPSDHAFSPAEDDVAIRAYLNYQNHGAADGHDVEDWLRAETELKAEHRAANSI